MNRFVLTICFLFAWISPAFSGPVLATDNFKSPCRSIADPPPNGFKLWSSQDTWKGSSIPGIGNAIDSNVTIPCNVAILLDVPKLQLHTLRVQGFLKFLDSRKLPSIYIRAHYILVEGQFTIGSPSTQFKSTAKIELTPNLKGKRADFMFTSNSPADPSHPRNLGHKAFAVVGGQVHLHGLPISPGKPVWSKLSTTAKKGQRKLTLNQVVDWPVGSEIVVASTDYNPDQAEVFVITSKTDTPKGSQLGLNKPFQFMHYGDPMGLPDGFGGYLDQCAEVALLSRKIIIAGTKESAPNNPEGGHFIIFHTQKQQFIEGVDFQNMGQQGKLGRYPIHFHFNGDHDRASGTVCRKNTIRFSNQRCLVIHATFGMRIEENVAYFTKGHCFMTEEGGETNNHFIRNIGIAIKPVEKLIPMEKSPEAFPETDIEASVFWISHPNNHLIDNVAAGSANAGIWLEMRRTIRGLSRTWNKINGIVPTEAEIGNIKGNTVHSTKIGLKLYPQGLVTKVRSARRIRVISNLNAYKNSWMGVLSRRNDGFTFNNFTLADNQIGVWMRTVEANVLKNSRVVGLSNNYGNPVQCDKISLKIQCISTKSCRFPVPKGEIGRSIGWDHPKLPLYGVQFDQQSGMEKQHLANSVINTKFSNFVDRCWPAAAISTTGDFNNRYWNSANYVRNLQISKESNHLWMNPRTMPSPIYISTFYFGDLTKYSTLRDMDGSLIGFKGYAVADNPSILPVNANKCKFQSSWNAYACSGVCYRTVLIEYVEPGFNNYRPGELGDFSSLSITRVEDKKSFQENGNFLARGLVSGEESNGRYFYFNLAAGYTYTIKIQPSSKKPNFAPAGLTISYKDLDGCGVPLVFRIPALNDQQWAFSPSPIIFFKPCDFESPSKGTRQSYYRYLCLGDSSVLEITELPPSTNSITILSSSKSSTCESTTECSLTNMGDSGWRYDVSGSDSLHPEFIAPSFDDSSWPIGITPFGNRVKFYKTLIPPPSESRLSYYYRKTFSLTTVSCYASLNVDVLMQDGGILYMNGREFFRLNLPGGKVTSSTLALVSVDGDYNKLWKRFNVPVTSNGVFLVQGNNFLAAEVHSFYKRARTTAFSIRVSALKYQQC